MALILAGALFLGAALDDGDVESLADRAGLDPVDLSAAAATVGVSPYEYLIGEGLIDAPAPLRAPILNPSVERRLDCISWYESRGYPGARNPRSGAAGAFQFLLSTWASTPQGRAGLSPYDPIAAREAARWMLAQGRAREWVPVQLGLC